MCKIVTVYADVHACVSICAMEDADGDFCPSLFLFTSCVYRTPKYNMSSQ